MHSAASPVAAVQTCALNLGPILSHTLTQTESAAGAAATPSSGGGTTGKAVSKQGNKAKQQSRSKKQRRGCECKHTQERACAQCSSCSNLVLICCCCFSLLTEAAPGKADAATGTPSRGGGKTGSTSRRQRPARTGERALLSLCSAAPHSAG